MSAFFVNRLEGRMLPAVANNFPEVPLFRNLPQPLNYRLLLWPRPVSRESKGGIAIPDEVIEQLQYQRQVCCVLAVGSKCFNHVDLQEENPPKVGDWILVPKHAGEYVDHEGVVEGTPVPISLKVVRDIDILLKYPNGLEDVMGI